MKRLLILSACLTGCLLLGGCTEKTLTAPKNQTTSFDDYLVLGEYKGIQIDPIEVSEEDVQSEISRMLEDNAEVIQITDREAIQGDMVNIDYEGTQDGIAFENGSYQNQFLELGSGDRKSVV